MNEQEALEYARKTMRCETCKYLTGKRIERECIRYESIVDDYAITTYKSTDFGCIHWEKKDEETNAM